MKSGVMQTLMSFISQVQNNATNSFFLTFFCPIVYWLLQLGRDSVSFLIFTYVKLIFDLGVKMPKKPSTV